MMEKQYWLDKPSNVKRLLVGLYLLCAGLLLTDALHHRHPILQMEGWFGFYSVYGFVACVILVLTAKEFRKLVARPKDYYENNDDQ